MRNVTDRTRNPFGMAPPCDRFVPGYGDANADFHVIGDHPGVHGGIVDGIPFTGEPWSPLFLDTLTEAELLRSSGETADAGPLDPGETFLSFLHMCVPENPAANGNEEPTGSEATAVSAAESGRASSPTESSYREMELFFDAELRAIAAHVLLPVGDRVTTHVLEQYTAQANKTEIDMEKLHATEIRGSGWLVVPVKDPRDWSDADATDLVEALRELKRTDYRRESDLGRFIAGDDPYLVR